MVEHENDVLQQVFCLNRKVGPFFSWCDNYDIVVCKLNGWRETHCMCQPAGEILPRSAHVG